MKIKRIVIGVLMIALAVLGLLEVSGILEPLQSTVGEMSFVNVIAAVILLALIIDSLVKLNICSVVFLLACLFMVVERNIAYMCGLESENIINNWALLVFTAIICIGLKLIFPNRKRHGAFAIGHRGSGNVGFASISGENTLGSYTEYIDCALFTKKHIENTLGQTIIRFENISEYQTGGTLSLENNLGHMIIHVPSEWNCSVSMENNLGSINNKCSRNATGDTLYLKGENNLGAIDILPV